MGVCFRCGQPIPEPNVAQAIDRELDWRDNFPNSQDEKRVLICNDCFDEISDEESPEEWERNNV
jgi:hypothetical protein